MAAKKLHVLREYLEEVWQLRGIATLAIGVGVVASVLLDAVIPTVVATIPGMQARGAGIAEFTETIVIVVVSFALGAVLIPLRHMLRRILQDRGHNRLVEKIDKAIYDTPDLGSKIDDAARKEFIDNWERFLVVLIDQFIPFVMGVLGLLVVLWFKAPVIIIPVLLILVVTILVAYKVGDVMGSHWERYKDRSHTEQALMSSIGTSAGMLWLVEIFMRLRRKAGRERSAAMRGYIGAMVRYQLIMAVLSNGFKLAVIVGSIVLGAVFHVSDDVTTLLLFFGVGLGDRLGTIFNMNDMLTNSAVDAEALVTAMEEAKPLGPELCATESVIEFRGKVVVEYRDKEEEAKALAAGKPIPAPVLVSIPDRIIGPGITAIYGPSGCGKTTGLRALGGMVPLKTGTVLLGNIELEGYDPRARMVYLQQSIEGLKGAIAEDLFDKGITPENREKALRYAAISPDTSLGRKLKGGYSGGERVRLVLAGAISAVLGRDRSMAGVLGMDEPTNNLGKHEIPRLLKGIRSLADDDPGLAIIIVTHEPQVMQIADQIIDWGEV